MKIREYLKNNKLICDGAFGTYYGELYDTDKLPELANIDNPERVMRIHREYINAGAGLIRSNTYACNTAIMKQKWSEVEKYAIAGYKLAKEATAQMDNCFAAADIGPIPWDNIEDRESVVAEYINLCRAYLSQGAEIIVFETFPGLEDIYPALEYIGDKAFVILQFSVNQFGYSNGGLSARKLLAEGCKCPHIDAVGLNCGVGPGHMMQLFKSLRNVGGKYITAFPNAGYPQKLRNRMCFLSENEKYFSGKIRELAEYGVSILGGCCGTTPEYIRCISRIVDTSKLSVFPTDKENGSFSVERKDNSFFVGKSDRKLIAVELAPPMGSDDERLMEAAHFLENSAVDVVTFPDSPSGRTRADSILMAKKVAQETKLCVMPHICCRDKNAIAIRSQLLGAGLNDINNFLVITGDPIPSMERNAVKSVFNFDSVGLMKIINDMNEEQFAHSPVCFGGAINQTRRNLEVEINRVKKKMDAGAIFFMSQPVSTTEGVERLRRIKAETGARILCGIMPFVSYKNAMFMKNEMTGIDVSDDVLNRYRPDMTREEGENAGIALAREIMALTSDFVDGYYFSFPFNRVWMLEKILE